MKRLILILCIGFLLGSCKREKFDHSDVPDGSVNITFGFQFSGSSSPITRSGDVVDKDLKIGNIAILAFEQTSNGTGQYLSRISGIVPTSGGQFTASLRKTTSPVTIHIFANSDTKLTGNFTSQTENDVIKSLLTGEVDPSGTTTLDMHGSLDFDAIDEDITDQTVRLLRAVARVDITASAVASDFILTDVRAYFTPKHGRLVSASVGGTAEDPEVTAPTMPEGYTISDTTHTEAYTGNVADNSITNGFFIYENTNNRPIGTEKVELNTRIIVGGTYEDQTCYYPLDVTTTESAILRNYKYTFNITAVTGLGYSTPHNAAYGITSNITVDEVGSKDWVAGEITIINPPSDVGIEAGDQDWGTGDQTIINK